MELDARGGAPVRIVAELNATAGSTFSFAVAEAGT